MAESGIKSYFPSQTVSDAEKLSYEYGLKVAKAKMEEVLLVLLQICRCLMQGLFFL